MQKSVFIWVGPGVDYEALLASLDDHEIASARFFIVNTLQRGEFLDMARARVADVDVASYTSLDSVNDPPIYRETRRIARTVVRAFYEDLERASNKNSDIWKAHLERALAINFGDHLYSACRALVHARRFLPDGATRVWIAEAAPRRAWFIRDAFQRMNLDCRILVDFLPEPRREPMRAVIRLDRLERTPRTSGRYPSSQIQAHHDLWLGEQTIFVSSRLKDDMFVSAVMPVIRELTHDFDVFIYDQQIYTDDRWWAFESYGIEDAEDRIFWAWRTQKRHSPQYSIPTDHPVVAGYLGAYAQLERMCESRSTPLRSICRESMLEMTMHALIPTYMSAFEMSMFIETNADLFVAGIFCPGRILESLSVCETLKWLDRPTFDLQSGTISPSDKFFAPTADYLIAIDEYSADVLNGYHGFPARQTHVVGSPRLDHHLAPLKVRSEESLRREHGVPVDRKIVTFMSQPIALGMLETIVRTLVQGARLLPDDLLWLIKPHPREHQAFYDLYERVIAEVGATNVEIDRDTGTYPLLKMSDAVVTYCSTAGLEGFALGKPVFAINPLTEPLPYDLVQLGVAIECRDAETLAREVALGLEEKQFNEKYYLQDGKSAARAAEVIKRAIVNPGLLGHGSAAENPEWVRARTLYDETRAAALGDDSVFLAET